MWIKITRYGQPALLCLLGISLLLWSIFSTSTYFLNNRAILGISIALFSGICFYFDSSIHKLFSKAVLMNHTNLNAGIVVLHKHLPQPKHIRIFAVTSTLILPILRSINKPEVFDKSSSLFFRSESIES